MTEPTRERVRERFVALCRSGVGPGLPRKRRDARIFLRCVAASLGPGPRSQRELDVALDDWLDAAGPRVDLDRVTLRRALVDEGFVVRDGAGTEYRVAPDEELGVGTDPLAWLEAERRRVGAKRDEVLRRARSSRT